MNNKEDKNKKKKSKGILKKVLLVILVLIIIAGGYIAYKTYKNGGGLKGFLATMVGHDEYTKKNLPEFRVLLLGISTDIDSKLSDTIMVASYNPNTQSATLLSIPRDTYVGKNKNKVSGMDKINALYQKSPQDTLDAINDITGLDIEYYIVIENDALIELVDVIGGVEFDVPIDMDYDDPSQDLHIHLTAGMQKLDGDKAEQLVRFRHNNNGTTYPSEYGTEDIGRMRTQREFMKAVLSQTIQAKNILKLGNILEVGFKNIETNVKLSVAKDYLPYIVEFNTENLKNATLPGTTDRIPKNTGLWFFLHDEEETEELVQELFYNQQEETTEETTTNTISNNIIDNNDVTSKSNIKIEVINGSGSSSKLTKVTNLLKKEGYDVYKTGTTKTVSKTTIVNKTNQSSSVSKNIKSLLGIGTVSSKTSNSSNVDFTITIGKDYK